MPKEIEIQKNTYRDKESRLYKAVEKQVKREKDEEYHCYHYTYLKDWDDSFVYVSSNNDDYRYSYSEGEGGVISIDLESETEGELVINSTFSVKTEPSDMEKSILKTLTKFFGGSAKEVAPVETQPEVMILKQFDEEEMVSYDPLCPPPNVADGHEEALTEEEIVKAVDQINELIAEGTPLENLSHGAPIKSAWKYQEAFVSPWPECKVGDTVVQKGQAVLVTKYHNQRAWELRKEGRIKGPSMGAGAVRVLVEEQE